MSLLNNPTDILQNVVHNIFVLCATFCLLFGLSHSSCVAQYHVSGNNDAKIKYRQIKTDKFHIVYPDYYEQNAQLLASILDTVVPIVGSSLGTRTPNVPILIHTKSAISNGLSVWAPKRMEFWTTPPPNNYAYPYLWQLAIHEYRHTAQMQAMNVGITKVLSNILGEHITGAVAGIFIPDWFFEGDAVVAETALAPAGRGQEPEFNMQLKAQVLDKGRYSIDKMLLGSMKDFVCDEYNLGYFLISYGREKYGKDIWGKALNHVGKSWWRLSMWGKTGNKDESLDFASMYNAAIDSLEKVWIDNDISYFKISKEKPLKQWNAHSDKEYVNYKNPIQINDSTILALKSSNYETQSLVKITNDKEETLVHLPFLLHSYFQYLNGKILYSQYSPNIRWQQEANADIMEYDIKKNKLRIITSDAAFFSPIYYPADSVIAAIYTDSLDNQNLAFIAPNTSYFTNRNILKKNKSSFVRIVNNENKVSYSYPAWEDTTAYVYFIETSANGKDIIRYNVTTQERLHVIPTSYDNIKYLKIYNGRLFFIKDVNNKFQLLSINLNDYGDVKIHTDSRYGVDNYCIYDSTVVISDYTANGYRIISIPYEERSWDINRNAPELYFTHLNREQEGFILDENTIKQDTVYASSKYKKRTHLFNFHSWAPLFLNVESKDLGIGVSAFSQNLLSTSVLEFGFKANFHDKNELYMHYTYSGQYPVMQLSTTFRPRDIRKELDSNMVDYLGWNEISVAYDISLPFTWNNRNYTNAVDLTMHYSLHDLSSPDDDLVITLFNAIGYFAKISNYAAMAKNDLYPRTGHITTVKYTHTLTSPFSNIFSVQSQIFLPGLVRNHSLMSILSFQKNTPDVYYFPNEVNFVRGVYNLYPKYFIGGLFTYNFPLIYPDDGVAGVFYVKRIAAKPFFNVGYYDKERYYSYGTDMVAKVHLFRITVPLDLGFRLGYCPTTDNTFASFLFSIDI